MRNTAPPFASSATVTAQPWNPSPGLGLCLLTLRASVHQLMLNFSKFGFSKGPCGWAAAPFMLVEYVAFAILESQILTIVQGNRAHLGRVFTALWLLMPASTEM